MPVLDPISKALFGENAISDNRSSMSFDASSIRKLCFSISDVARSLCALSTARLKIGRKVLPLYFWGEGHKNGLCISISHKSKACAAIIE